MECDYSLNRICDAIHSEYLLTLCWLFQASLVCDEFEHVRASPRENQNNNALDSSFSTNGGFEDFESPNGVTTGAGSSHDTSLELGGERSTANGSGVRSSSTVRKGLLWQQRDKIFSQWKERYFILTPDYLQCFKKGTSRITEMGEFIFKVRKYIIYLHYVCLTGY